MTPLSRCSAGFFALSLVALTTGPATAVVQPLWGGGGQNLSGMYSGTVSDSVLGSGTAGANLTQFNTRGGGQGDPLGGWFAFMFGTTTYNNPTSAQLNAARHHCGGGGQGQQFADCGDWGGRDNSLAGVFEMTVGSAACSFSYKATYSSSSFQLDGTYQAVVGCSGESGTFALTQQCYYKVNGLRRNTGSGPGACS